MDPTTRKALALAHRHHQGRGTLWQSPSDAAGPLFVVVDHELGRVDAASLEWIGEFARSLPGRMIKSVTGNLSFFVSVPGHDGLNPCVVFLDDYGQDSQVRVYQAERNTCLWGGTVS